ncbi:MAG: hypothetical protein ACE5FD_04980 [Anaerolineae bacterium]
MLAKSPYHWLTHQQQNRLFVFFFVLTLVVMAALQILGRPLTTDAAPAGIVSFELAGDLASARQMIASWGPDGGAYAGLNLGLDFLFMALYPVAIGLGCVLVGRTWLPFVGSLLAWGQLAAGLLDVVENASLIQVLLGANTEWWPGLARWCAIPKFSLVVLGLVFVLVGTAVKLVKR